MQKQHHHKKLLFVYGSLKRGFDNHSLLKGATYVGEAKTLQPYAMFVETHGQYPYLIDKPFYQIEGELYDIDSEELWDKVDTFEGVPDYIMLVKRLWWLLMNRAIKPKPTFW